MRKNNEPEARVLACKQVPYSVAEDAVWPALDRLVDSLDTPDGGKFGDCESELDGVVLSLRNALVEAIEERLDLRDHILAMCNTAEDLGDLLYSIRYRLEGV